MFPGESDDLQCKQGSQCPTLHALSNNIYDESTSRYASLIKALADSIEAFMPHLDSRRFRAPNPSSVRSMATFIDEIRVLFCHETICTSPACLDAFSRVEADFLPIAEFIPNSPSPLAAQHQRLAMGQWMHELIGMLGSTDKKFAVISSHDNTLMAILSALGVQHYAWPAYASSLVFEVWQSNTMSTRKFIRILNNGTPIPVSWCDFEHGCPMARR